MAKEEYYYPVKVEDGMVVGYVSTNRVGSECEFDVCSKDVWDEMDNKERDKLLEEAMHESGQMEYGIKSEK